MQVHLSLRNLFAQIAAKYLFRIVQNMERTLFNLNVNIVVQPPNGFAGEIHIFASLVIRNNAMEIMLVNILSKSYQNVKGQGSVP